MGTSISVRSLSTFPSLWLRAAVSRTVASEEALEARYGSGFPVASIEAQLLIDVSKFLTEMNEINCSLARVRAT